MTKKRFIKLLMSCGEPRNQARRIALLYNFRNIPYAKAYSDYHYKKIVSFSMACAKFHEGIVKCTQSIKKLAEVMKYDR